jgi:hypothetical protein
MPLDWLQLSYIGAHARSREGDTATCFIPNPHANRRAPCR